MENGLLLYQSTYIRKAYREKLKYSETVYIFVFDENHLEAI